MASMFQDVKMVFWGPEFRAFESVAKWLREQGVLHIYVLTSESTTHLGEDIRRQFRDEHYFTVILIDKLVGDGPDKRLDDPARSHYAVHKLYGRQPHGNSALLFVGDPEGIAAAARMVNDSCASSLISIRPEACVVVDPAATTDDESYKILS